MVLFSYMARLRGRKSHPVPNEEHLNILKQGAYTWNQWRSESDNLYIQPDLRKADLGGVDLGATDLSWANLSWADLSKADLGEAYLSHANLSYANLNDADLSKAHLIMADLSSANLSGATLAAAKVGYTAFVNVDLREVKGLEILRHEGPSSIGIDTIYRSEGKIPAQFLRGAGVPDNFIEYMHSLVGAAFEYYSCFISYSTKDQEFADRLYRDLQAEGVRCWFAPHELRIGDRFRQRIDDAVRLHDKLLVVLSEASVSSTWVESEVEGALERESAEEGKLVLFPIRVDGAVMETKQAWASDIRRKRHIGDFCDWQHHNLYQKSFQRLLRDLRGEKEQGTAAE